MSVNDGLESGQLDKFDTDHVEDLKRNHDETLSQHEWALEKHVKWKLDLTLVALFAIGYFLASMGRSDLGNARIAGLTEDLRITDQQYSNIASMFYVGYLIFQLPSTLIIRKITPPVQVFLSGSLWGLFTCCIVAAKSYGSVLALRILVGAAEALLQGGVYFLSVMYRPRELALRIAIIFSTSSLAGACNGLIALGVEEDLNGVDGWAAWQWLFLIEGVIPIGFSFISLTFVPPSPEKARFFFNAEEKALMARRSRESQNTSETKFRPKLLIRLFLDPVFWGLFCIYTGVIFATTALTSFLPVIVESFGWSSTKAQAMSVIPYAISAVTTLLWAFVSDRIGQRLLLIMGNTVLSIVGFILWLTVEDKVVLMVGACMVLAGLQPAVALTTTLIPNSLAGHMFRASGVALVNAFAQAVAISASQAYSNPANLYRTGNITALCMTAFTGVSAAVLRLYFVKINAAKAKAQDTPAAEEVRRTKNMDDIGNRHPDFFFIL